MLYQQVEQQEKEHKGGIITATGVCRFCGQIKTQKALEAWNETEIDELVAETCDCSEARYYSGKKERKERADESIRLLFGQDNGNDVIPEAAVDLLCRAAELACEGLITNITVGLMENVKGKINVTSKGEIKVARTKTDTRAREI